MVNDADQEEVERFKKAISTCRTCGHVKMAHSVTGKKVICLDATLTNKEKYKPCECKVFIPKDNLEFLEWAAKNRVKK